MSRLSVRRLSLVHRLSVFVLLVTFLVFAVLTTVLARKTSREALAEVETALQRKVDLIAGTFDVLSQSVAGQIERLSTVFAASFPEGLTLDSTQTVRVGSRDVHALVHGDEGVVNLRFAKPDRFTALTGGVATVFVRDGEDLVRISTSLRDAKGERTVGTVLDRGHPAYRRLLAGEPYLGLAQLFGRQYVTKYLPLRGEADGKVIGALFVGLDFNEALDAVKRHLLGLKFGETGYAYAVAVGEGAARGRFTMHPTQEAQSLAERTDEGSRVLFQRLTSEDKGVVHYAWREGEEVRDKVVAFRRTPGFEWAVAAGGYTDEFLAPSRALRNWLIVGTALSALLLLGLVYTILQHEIARLRTLQRDFAAVGRGDLTVRLHSGSGESADEIDRLARQLDEVTASLRGLVGNVLASVARLGQSSTQVSLVVDKTSEGIHLQERETDQAAAAVTEMAAAVQEVARNVARVAEATQDAKASAEQGSGEVERVASAMGELATDVRESSEVIRRLAEETRSIGAVIDILRGVAEQTNLLALNAAIEAARAGEHGRGFAVVADQVRGLAAKTRQSTVDIYVTLERLQSRVAEAVQRMESGQQRATEALSQAAEARQGLEGIAAGASRIADMTTQIAAAAEEQSIVAEEINRSVTSMRDVTVQTAVGVDELTRATRSLEELAQGLQAAVGGFRV